MIANSILYSSLTDLTIRLPLDPQIYKEKLQELISNSDYTRQIDNSIKNDDFNPPYIHNE